MKKGLHMRTALVLSAGTLAIAACGSGNDRSRSSTGGEVYNSPSATPAASATPATSATSAAPSAGASTADTALRTGKKHHSKLAGAAAGAAVGHMLGGHAVLGAAAGALAQHERNKHP